MEPVSVASTTSEDLHVALERFARSILKPLFEQISLDSRRSLYKDIQLELRECSQDWKKVCADLKQFLSEGDAKKSQDRNSMPAAFPQSGHIGCKQGDAAGFLVATKPTVVAALSPDPLHCPTMQVADIEELPPTISACFGDTATAVMAWDPEQRKRASEDIALLPHTNIRRSEESTEVEAMNFCRVSSRDSNKSSLLSRTSFQKDKESPKGAYKSTRTNAMDQERLMTRKGRAPRYTFLELEEEQQQLEEYVLHNGENSLPPTAHAAERNSMIVEGSWTADHVVPESSPNKTPDKGRRVSVQIGAHNAGSMQVVHKASLLLKKIVLSSQFDYLAGMAIISNAIILGVQTDYMAREFTDEVPLVFQVLEKAFGVVFTLELMMRLFTFRTRFFYMQGWKWNIFDMIVVSIQLVEEVISLFASEGSAGNNFGALRMLRVLRLVRIVRLVRVLRLIGELRTIVVSMMGCMRSLLWTIILLLLMIYMIGVYLTQLVSDHKVQNQDEYLLKQQELETLYGSLGSSILALFQAITGGLNWQNAVNPLMQYISPWLSVLFALYVCFALLAMMNVVTGVFVESALENAKRDKETYLLQHVKNLFATADVDGSGEISWSQFESQLALHPDMKVYFEHCGLDAKEAENLFILLDTDESGTIDAEEFVNSFFKLRGNAKAIDLAMLSYEFLHLTRKITGIEDMLSDQCNGITSTALDKK